MDFDLELFAQRVDYRCANAVETARNLVGLLVELAAGMQHRHYDLEGGFAFQFRIFDIVLGVDRDAAAVVQDRHGTIGVNRHINILGKAGQHLIDRVIDGLINEVMHASRTGGTDIHAWSLPDRLQALEHGDFTGVVVGGFSGHGFERCECGSGARGAPADVDSICARVLCGEGKVPA